MPEGTIYGSRPGVFRLRRSPERGLASIQTDKSLRAKTLTSVSSLVSSLLLAKFMLEKEREREREPSVRQVKHYCTDVTPFVSL